jgi:hypothetical protein
MKWERLELAKDPLLPALLVSLEFLAPPAALVRQQFRHFRWHLLDLLDLANPLDRLDRLVPSLRRFPLNQFGQ